MSYDLYLWKWGEEPHISPAACFLLMADGVECHDAAILPGTLREELLGSVSRLAGTTQVEAAPRGLIVEAHGSNVSELIELTRRFADRHGLEVFDPQAEKASEGDEREARAVADRLRREDERVGYAAELPELLAAAERGDGHALAELGNRSYFGEGVERDMERAFRCYLRSAETGHEAGMLNVASCYRRGEGVPQDTGLAVRWYERAMETDGTFAPFELATMHETGEGVPPDPDAAKRLYFIALEGDHPDARKALRRLGALPPPPEPFVRR